MPTVSLAMIVRDEESHLGDCLASCADLFDEIVIVDTGSTDRTKEIAAAARDKHGQPARVFDFAWCDDFAAARNESIDRASGDWIFWMDADERLDQTCKPILGSLIENYLGDPSLAYGCQIVSLNDDGSRLPPVRHVRLFANRPEIRFFGRIHEDVQAPAGGNLADSGVVVWHLGYRDGETFDRKRLRNMRLLELQLADQPDDPRTLYHLAGEYADAGRRSEAARLFARSQAILAISGVRPAYYARLLAGVASTTDEPERTAAVRELALLNTSESDWLLRQLSLNG